MLQALRCRVGMRAVLSTRLPPRCLANAATSHRCLGNAAAATSKGRPDTAAAAAAVASDPHGTQQTAAGAGVDGTPMETDEMGNPKHILLYEGSKRNVRISSAVTVVNGLYWSFYVGVLEAQLPTTTWEPWGYIGITFTAVMALASHTFARHWVSQISYLPDLRLLSIGTHTYLGRERMPRLVRLGGTIFPRTPPGAIYLMFKVRGDYFNSLLDTEDGVFHDRELLMRLLKASPNEKVAEPSSATASESSDDSTTAGKPKKKGKKTKRRRK